MKYTDPDYAWNRLGNTFISHEGKLVRVRDYRGDFEFVLEDKHSALKRVHLSNMDLTPVPLGYVNHSDSAIYVTRAPLRRDWKQGLRVNNIRQHTTSGYEYNLPLGREIDLFVISDTIEGIYPNFPTTLARVEETHQACAFSRMFCLNEEGQLRYKGEKTVGQVISDRVISLKENFIYLREVLIESLGGQPVEVRIA